MSGIELRAPTPEEISRDWEEFTGGPPVFGVLREYAPDEVEGLLLEDAERGRALVTWCIDGDVAEITSLHAVPQGSRLGARIMDAAEEELRRRGVKRIVLGTTNDNVRALTFYQRRGYRLTRLHADAMDRVRARKPGVPEVGADGIPLRDMWELEKALPGVPAPEQ